MSIDTPIEPENLIAAAIDAAEDIRDPLDGLVEKASTDPGARFMLAAAYDFLRTTQPFKAWKLPESDDIGFHVIRDKKLFADFGVENGIPLIRVSEAKNGHTATILGTLAHEMIHLRQELTGDKEVHGARFQKTAKRICAIHGFDPKTF